MDKDLITRLRKRAEIRRQIPSRKSVQEGKNDRIADLLEEAAKALEDKNAMVKSLLKDRADLSDETVQMPLEKD